MCVCGRDWIRWREEGLEQRTSPAVGLRDDDRSLKKVGSSR